MRLFRLLLIVSLLIITKRTLAKEVESPKLWWGADVWAGPQRLKTDLASELPKSGFLLGGRAYGEYRTSQTGSFGLGLGLQQTWQEGENTVRYQEFILRAASVDLAYFYPLTPSFGVGWLVRNQLGKGANFKLSNISSFQWLFTTGPQVRWIFSGKNVDWTIGASFQYALGNGDRTIWNIPIQLGVLFPIRGETHVPPPVEKSVPAPVVATTEPKTEVKPALVEEKPMVAVNFDASLITFDLNQATLKPKSKAFLAKVAKALIEQKDNWKSILIAGHTDVTGTASKNKDLSRRRAKSVLNWLVQESVPADRLSSAGYGSEKLLADVPPNSPDHRRVELMFDGVLDGAKINDAMSALKSQK